VRKPAFFNDGRLVSASISLRHRATPSRNAPRLAGGTATVDPGDDVEPAFEFGHPDTVVHQLLVHLVREVGLERTTVDLPGSTTGYQTPRAMACLRRPGSEPRER
jgi:hypothetical protein